MLKTTVNNQEVHIQFDFPEGYLETGSFFHYFAIKVDLTRLSSPVEANEVIKEFMFALGDDAEYQISKTELVCKYGNPKMIAVSQCHMLGNNVEEMVSDIHDILKGIATPIPYVIEIGVTSFDFNW